MAGRVVPMQFGDVEVLVETVTVAGTEPTSRLDAAAERVTDTFERAKVLIAAIARSTEQAVGAMGDAVVDSLDKVEVEFGIGFSVKGNVIVTAGQVDTTLKVKLVHNVNRSE